MMLPNIILICLPSKSQGDHFQVTPLLILAPTFAKIFLFFYFQWNVCSFLWKLIWFSHYFAICFDSVLRHPWPICVTRFLDYKVLICYSGPFLRSSFHSNPCFTHLIFHATTLLFCKNITKVLAIFRPFQYSAKISKNFWNVARDVYFTPKRLFSSSAEKPKMVDCAFL